MTTLTFLLIGVVAALPWTLTGRTRTRRPTGPGAGPVPERLGEIDVAVLLDLADAALGAGASVPGTLLALGRAVAGHAPEAGDDGGSGPALRRAGRALLLGAPWAEAWDGAPDGLGPLADALEPAWVDGAAPGPLLRQAAGSVRATRHREAQEAAARLGVRLVLPLGLCFLPAFVLLGLVPVVLAAGGAVLGG
ncbi:type II secretion system F family protein [Georgenia daeguensis]|uniref:Type II secretion system protein GspF domain-containing protein n=1 Tax=Georgenia daeguensis TaxID=908355 RepID=A0ABP6ULY8_9MICO